jgi:hypothetical protein
MLVFLQEIIPAMFVTGLGAVGSGLHPERSESSARVILGFPLPATKA